MSRSNVWTEGVISEPRVDLVPIGANPSWSLQANRKVHLVGGHGEEIVRTVYIDNEVSVYYSMLICSILTV